MDILLKELNPGAKYIFQARSKSVTGKTSAWSTSFEHTTLSDTVAPAPVTGLDLQVIGTSFVAAWTKPSFDANGKLLRDFKDYKVTVTAGLESVVYFVAQEKFDFPIEVNRNSFGTPEPTIEVAVQARDLVGNLSTTVSDTATNPIPSDVSNFIADGVSDAVALTWDAVADTDLKYYKVHVSTAGAGFTPGPSNLVFTGATTSFLYPTSNYITHYFKIAATDVYDQESANYAAASATPTSSSGIDLTPPADPTNVTVSTSVDVAGASLINVSWDLVASSNLSDYLVRYSTDEIAWRYLNVPAGQESATITNLIPSTNYYVQVAAMSQANVKSDFVNALTYPIQTAADTTAPSQPAAPVVSTSALAAQVSHDMTKQAGGDLEADVAYLEVHASTSSGFVPDNSSLRGTIDVAGPGVDVSGVFYYPSTDATTDLYWKVVAVDRAKNKSAASNNATGVPGLILNANIANATITSAKIQDLEANKIVAGTGIINALDIKETLTVETGGHVRSSDWNGIDTGWSLDNTGLVIYDGTISALALQLQDSVNIIPPAFADFEFNADYYHTSQVANATVMSTVGTGVNVDILESDNKFGEKCLRLFNTVITNPTVHDLVFAPGGLAATDLNVEVSPGTYIFSGYFKKNGAVDALLKFGFYPETGSAIVSAAAPVNSTAWTRFEAQLVVPSGVSRVKAYIELGPDVSNTGYDVLIDGLQIERKMTGATTAGPWRPPSKTTIDGGQIVTGSIRSSAPSATVEDQPAWSINTAGGMQVGDAVVRGALTVGSTDSQTINILPDEFTSFEKEPSYYADEDNMQAPSGLSTAIVQPSGGIIGNQYISIVDNDLIGNDDMSVWRNIYLAPQAATSAVTNNVVIGSGQLYICSFYVKNFNPAKEIILRVGFWQSTTVIKAASTSSTSTADINIDITAYTDWTRITTYYTGAPNLSSAKVLFSAFPQTGTTGLDFGIDGLMVEERLSEAQVDASAFVSGYVEDSYISSANYVNGQTGWKIDGKGNADFNNTAIRGYFRTTSELGAIEINLFDIRPTIKFHNSDFSNFAWINIVDDTGGQANIGINQGVVESDEYPGTLIHSRMWMVDPMFNSELGFVKDADQTRIGGGMHWSDRAASLRVDDNVNVPRSEVYIDTSNGHLQTYDAGGTLASRVWVTSDGWVQLENATAAKGKMSVSNTGTVDLWGGDNKSHIQVSNIGIVYVQGGDGTSLNGPILITGGNQDPYFHVLNEGWEMVTPAANWGFRSTFYRLSTKITALGQVHMFGTMWKTSSSAINGELIGTIATKFRPAADSWVYMVASTGSPYALRITPAGQLFLYMSTSLAVSATVVVNGIYPLADVPSIA